MFTVNKNLTPTDLKKFGVAMFIGFFFIGAILFFLPWIKTRDVMALSYTGTSSQIMAFCFQGLGLLLWMISVTAPGVAKPIYVVWMSITVPIGIVMSTIMLSVLFFLLLPVFSIIVRMGDPIRKKLHSGETYWENYKPHEATIERMQRPF